ncbi:MAG: CHAT domain-containing protein [Acidimicrobiia bacterium]|nr:CHAT domain-containing protein [Acidimicrobiia bacterium]
MDEREYVDFDLSIEPTGDGLEARVLDSPSGEAVEAFEMPFTAEGLENFILKMGGPRSGVRRGLMPPVTDARGFGGALYDALFTGEIETCFRRSLDQADREEKGLRLRLRLGEVGDVVDIPWEFLYSEALGRFLVLSSETPLVRYIDLSSRIKPLEVEPPLRILMVVSEPKNAPPLDVEREQRLVRMATSDLVRDGRLELHTLPDATLSSLQHRLRQDTFHILHFVGHGGFDEATGDGVVYMEDDDGMARAVTGHDLGILLHDHRSLRIALLNACEGARTSTEDPFTGVAQSLVRQGIPAVVAMQFEITDSAAMVFSHEFFLSIADGYPVDAATSEARKAVFAAGNALEWATPVLYLRSEDGRVFDVQAQPSPPDTDRLLDEAKEHIDQGNATAATGILDRVLTIEPEHPDAEIIAAELRNADRVTELWTRAQELATDEPERAQALLDELRALDNNHPGAIELARQLAHASGDTTILPSAREPDVSPEPATPLPTPKVDKTPHEAPPIQPVVAKQPRKARTRRFFPYLIGIVLLAAVGFFLLFERGDPPPQTEWLEDLAPGFQVAFHVNDAPSIDGSDDDWPDIFEFVSDRLVAGPGDPEVTARWRLSWDESSLFVMARVNDPEVFQRRHGDPDQLFEGDSVSFEFSPNGGRRQADDLIREGEGHIMLGPDDGGGLGPLAVVNPGVDGVIVAGEEAEEIEVASQLTEDGYNIEAAIPWDFLEVRPAVGMPLRMNLNVSDTVAGGNLRSMRSNNPDRTAENQRVPAIWWHTLLWDDVATPPVEVPTVFGEPAVEAVETLDEAGFDTSLTDVCTDIMGAGLARQVAITDSEPENMVIDNGHLIPILPDGTSVTVKESSGPCG